MKYKYCLVILLLVCQQAFSADLTFNVVRVGVSDFSKTIFIISDRDIAQTECENKRQFKVPLDDAVYSSLVLSVAMQSVSIGKSVIVSYTPTSCIGDSQHVGNISIVK